MTDRQAVKPVGLCPRCMQRPRQPGQAYCAPCAADRQREARAERARRHKKAGAPRGAEAEASDRTARHRA